jgi:hypothetical protein
MYNNDSSKDNNYEKMTSLEQDIRIFTNTFLIIKSIRIYPSYLRRNQHN